MTSFYIDFAELSDAIESYENLIEKLETYNSSLIITTETINEEVYTGNDADILREGWSQESNKDIPEAIEQIIAVKDALKEARTDFNNCKKYCVDMAGTFGINTYMVHPGGMYGKLKCNYEGISETVEYSNNAIYEYATIEENIINAKSKLNSLNQAYDDVYELLNDIQKNAISSSDTLSTHKSELITYAGMVVDADDKLNGKLRRILSVEPNYMIKYGQHTLDDEMDDNDDDSHEEFVYEEITYDDIEELLLLQSFPAGYLPESEIQRMKELEAKLLSSRLEARLLYKDKIGQTDPKLITNEMRTFSGEIEATLSYGTIIDNINKIGRLQIEKAQLEKRLGEDQGQTGIDYCYDRLESINAEIEELENEIDEAILENLEDYNYSDEFSFVYEILDEQDYSITEKIYIYNYWTQIDKYDDIRGIEFPSSWIKEHIKSPAELGITGNTVNDGVYDGEKAAEYMDYYYNNNFLIDCISGLESQTYLGKPLTAECIREMYASADPQDKQNLYFLWYDYVNGGMYDYENNYGTNRAVKYGLRDFGFGDFIEQQGVYQVYTNEATTQFVFAEEAYVSKYEHKDHYFNCGNLFDAKALKGDQLLEYIRSDLNKYTLDGVFRPQAFTPYELEILEAEKNSGTYSNYGYTDYITSDRLIKEIEEHTNELVSDIVCKDDGTVEIYYNSYYDPFEKQQYEGGVFSYNIGEGGKAFNDEYIPISQVKGMTDALAAFELEHNYESGIYFGDIQKDARTLMIYDLGEDAVNELSQEKYDSIIGKYEEEALSSEYLGLYMVDDQRRAIDTVHDIQKGAVTVVNTATAVAAVVGNPVVSAGALFIAGLTNATDTYIDYSLGLEEDAYKGAAFMALDLVTMNSLPEAKLELAGIGAAEGEADDFIRALDKNIDNFDNFFKASDDVVEGGASTVRVFEDLGDDVVKNLDQFDNVIDDIGRVGSKLDDGAADLGKAVTTLDDKVDDSGRVIKTLDDKVDDAEKVVKTLDDKVDDMERVASHIDDNMDEAAERAARSEDVDGTKPKADEPDGTKPKADDPDPNAETRDDINDSLNFEVDVNEDNIYGDELLNSTNSEPLEVETSVSGETNEGDTDTVTYRRVQGGVGNKSSQQRVVIDSEGNVFITNHNRNLNVSIDNGEHAQYYINNNRPGADIYEFDVPKWFDDMVNEYTVPQAGAKGGCNPKLTDVTTPGKCVEFPKPWVEWIDEYSTNGRIIKGSGK